MSIKQISVFLENKPGALYAMTGVLAQNKIDMRAFSLAETSDFGIARMIVDDVYNSPAIGSTPTACKSRCNEYRSQ